MELVYADQDWATAAQQLSQAIARAAGTARIKTAKIGLIGHQAPGFVDLHPDPFALHKTFQGCILEHVGLSDLIQAAEAIDQASVDADRKLNVPGAFAERVDDERSSRLYLALKRLVEADRLAYARERGYSTRLLDLPHADASVGRRPRETRRGFESR